MNLNYIDKTWAEKMALRLDYNHMMDPMVKGGINQDEINNLSYLIKKADRSFKNKIEKEVIQWPLLPYEQNDVVEEILNYVASVKDKFEYFVVLGIGGSALGPMAVQRAIHSPYYNELDLEKRKNYPKFYIADNVDPERLTYLFDVIQPEKTLFNVITKSGSTSETMSQFMIIQSLLESKLTKEKAKENIVCTTDEEKGNLIKIAKQEGYKTFFIPSGVGGRFSELSPVGLLPAAMTGIDIKALLAGAAFMEEKCKSSDIYQNPAYMYGLLHYIAMTKNKNISVMMPYADSLQYISDWYAQLWAESLGKKYDNEKNEIFVGQTPVKALGVTDQHSQVQLYTEGPYDKVVVFLGVDQYRATVHIPKTYQEIPSLGFLGGATQNQLIAVEQAATEYALLKANRLNMTITLPEVNEFTIGQVLYLLEVATAFTGELLNIDPFDQPGVEEGKDATYAMFGRPGYEDKKLELDQRPKKQDRFMI